MHRPGVNDSMAEGPVICRHTDSHSNFELSCIGILCFSHGSAHSKHMVLNHCLEFPETPWKTHADEHSIAHSLAANRGRTVQGVFQLVIPMTSRICHQQFRQPRTILSQQAKDVQSRHKAET